MDWGIGWLGSSRRKCKKGRWRKVPSFSRMCYRVLESDSLQASQDRLLTQHYLVRIGAFGAVVRCSPIDDTDYHRGMRVVCRTDRGVELGQVVAGAPATQMSEAEILRLTTPEDELLDARLRKYKAQAVQRCQAALATDTSETVLLEVDQLLDGRTLVFYFLGAITPDVQALTDRLAEEYERKVRTRHFAKLLAEGCGPGCGTKKAGGCGGCAVCVVASACGSGT